MAQVRHFALVGWLLLTVLAPGQDSGRIRPPATLPCDRNHLTSFTGDVKRYQRSAKGLVITVRTDADTTERFTLRGKKARLEKQFLLRGQAFLSDDWQLLELSPARLRAGTRITVWACEKPSVLVFDWSPPTRVSAFQ